MRSLVLLLVALLVVTWARPAQAERDLIVPFEESGHLVLDQLSGLRVDGASGVGYAGFAGVSFRRDSVDGGGTTKLTTAYLAPAADVFVAEHLSVGGAIVVAHAWGSAAIGEQHVALPTTTSLTFVPRVGFYVAATDRIGLWPRVGLGWTRTETATLSGTATATDTFEALVLEADLSLVYRFHETFFLKTGPGIGATLGGEHAGGASGTSLAVSGTVGFGMNVEL